MNDKATLGMSPAPLFVLCVMISTIVPSTYTYNAPSGVRTSNPPYETPPPPPSPPPPCAFSPDTLYGGILADCQDQGLSSPPSGILPTNTTTLLLQNNSIRTLTNDSLVNLPDLKYLRVSKNGMTSVQASTFRYNTRLVVLDLTYNSLRLDEKSGRLPGNLLENLRDLQELGLGWNANDDEGGCSNNYPADLLEGLERLQILSLDTFSCPLTFDNIRLFKNTPSLSSVTLTGAATRVLNESFVGFDSLLNLKTVSFTWMYNLLSIEPGAFQYFKNIENLHITNSVQLGFESLFDSLGPLANRSLKTLSINEVPNDRFVETGVFHVLTQHSTRYLTQICVQNLQLRNNWIQYVEHGALTSGGGVLSRCIVSLDLSGNPLRGSGEELVSFGRFRQLQTFLLTNRKYSCLTHPHDTDDAPNYLATCLPKKDLLIQIEEKFLEHQEDTPLSHHVDDDDQITPEPPKETNVIHYYDNYQLVPTRSVKSLNRTEVVTGVMTFPNTKVDIVSTKNHIDILRLNKICPLHHNCFWVPRNLTYINLNRFSGDMGSADADWMIKGGGNVMEIHLSDCGLKAFVGAFNGVENLRVLDISKNDGSEMASRFFANFPRLTKLDMSDMRLNNSWILTEGLGVFGKMRELTILDLSGNDLHLLSTDVFSSNVKLFAVGLSRNRLKKIPMQLNRHPDMCLLDLRSNSFLRLSGHDIEMIETHSRKLKTFSVWLQGNVFSCGCSNIRFLSWLYKTGVNLDNEHGYSCILENGEWSTTSQQVEIKHVRGMWRECIGKTAFLSSLILACAMLLAYCLLYVSLKFETHLKASLMKFLGKTLPLKQRHEYKYDVYIGYSDNDVTLACQHLRHTIEDAIGYRRTYVRHRDLIPASDMAESVMTAIDASWRVLLIITDDFLRDDWSFLATKWAVHSVQDSNPDRLVVVFTSHRLPPQRILSSVMRVVPETNVVYLTDSWGRRALSPREQQQVESALWH